MHGLSGNGSHSATLTGDGLMRSYAIGSEVRGEIVRFVQHNHREARLGPGLDPAAPAVAANESSESAQGCPCRLLRA